MERIIIPCKVGDIVYKICPIYNSKHNGSCKNCAWSGCIRYNACDVGVGVCSDGSYGKHDLQVVEISVYGSELFSLIELWDIQYFEDKDEAEKALHEYDAIRKIENGKERYNAYLKWEADRKIKNPLRNYTD